MPNVKPMDKYPSNSHRAKEEPEEPVITPETTEDAKISPSVPSGDTPHKALKVIKGNVIKKKKSWLDSFTESFFGDDAKTVVAYVVWDVLIPAAKDTILEMIKTGGEMLLFGEGRRSDRIGRDRDRSYVSYNSYSGRDRDHGDRDRQPTNRDRNRSRFNFDDIVLERRSDAEETLNGLVDQIDVYNVATVADFYDMVGLRTEYTDYNWGWDNLSRAVVSRVRNGYIIELPKPYLLK